MSIKQCIEDGKAIKITPNIERAKGLHKKALKRKEFVESVTATEKNAEILLCELYEAILELLHALASAHGFKILDHLCIIDFAKEELQLPEFAQAFDRYRKIRNSSLYYGTLVDFKVAKNGIDEMMKLFQELEKLLK